jgi:hypothetical protein
MGKSYRNNDEYSKKWDRERQQRDSKKNKSKNKSKNNGQKKPLTVNTTWDSVNGDGNGSGDY